MKVLIDIDEEDFRIMQHNVAVDNPLCPLGEKEIVTKIANGTPILDDATNGDVIKALFPNYTIQINSICESVSVYYEGTEEYSGSWFQFDLNWWNAPYKKEVEEDD